PVFPYTTLFRSSRPASRAFVADNDDIASLDFTLEDDRDRLYLGLDNSCWALEVPQFLFNAGCLNDGTIRGQITAQNNQSALVRVGELCGVDTTIFLVGVQRFPYIVGGKWLRGAHAARRSQEEITRLF